MTNCRLCMVSWFEDKTRRFSPKSFFSVNDQIQHLILVSLSKNVNAECRGLNANYYSETKWIFSYMAYSILCSTKTTSLNMPVARPRYEIYVIKFSVSSEKRKLDFVSNFS